MSNTSLTVVGDFPMGRHIRVDAAFDRRDPDPSKNYGIHGAEMTFTVRRTVHAIAFVVFTNWQLPNVRAERDRDSIDRGVDDIDLRCFYHPRGAYLEYHSPTPHYADQDMATDECALVTGGRCYMNTQYTAAEALLDILIAGGSEALFAEMERRLDAMLVKQVPVVEVVTA